MHSKLCFQIQVSYLTPNFLSICPGWPRLSDCQGATAWGEECIKTLLEETRRIGFLILDES